MAWQAVLECHNLDFSILNPAFDAETQYVLRLVSASLVHADLRGAHLIGAYLIGAYLGFANLSGANLRGAHLSRADLRGAALIDADLLDANLGFANLSGAKNLTQTQLDEACGNSNTKLPEGLTLKLCSKD